MAANTSSGQTSTPSVISIQDLSTRCSISVEGQKCAVETAGVIRSPENAPRLYFQILKDADEGWTMGSVVLQPAGDGHVRPLLSELQEHVWGADVFQTQSPDGLLLVLQATEVGSAYEDASNVYLRVSENWRQINTRGWTLGGDDVPTGLNVSRGWNYDWSNLSATTQLYRPEDGNCCPTGGTIRAHFSINDDQLVLLKTELLPEHAEMVPAPH